MASTIASNKQLAEVAKQSARARIEDVLRMAVPALRRIGPDSSENRDLVAQLCGLPEPDQYIVDQDRLVGIDAAGGTLPMTKLGQPADFDKAMGAARLLVATINDAIDRYMAGDDARTAVEVKQYEASAR